MTLKIAVCDDDELDLNAEKEVIQSVFSEINTDCECGTFVSPAELLSSPVNYDMVFLDIKMEDMDGLSLAKSLMESNKNCFVFFITNYPMYLDRAFDVRAFRYFSKPLDRPRLKSGIKNAMERINDRVKVLRLTNRKNKVAVSIEISSIIYIETDNRHTHVVSAGYDFVAEQSFKDVKSSIEKEVGYFAQSHQSYLVNMRYVTHYDRSAVVLTYGGKNYKVDMSRRQYGIFDEKMFKQARDIK